MNISLKAKHNTLLYSKKRINEEYNGKIIYLTISGSHIYGWSSEDSDVDWRGVFLTGTENLLGMWHKRNHLTELDPIDLVLNELGKELGLLLKGNCNALERIYSNPFYKSPEFFELKELVDRSLHKVGVWHSYRGLAIENYNKFIKKGVASTYKKWLYIIRALHCGMHYLNTGKIQPDITKLPYKQSDDLLYLLDRKIHGNEEGMAELTPEMEARLSEEVLSLQMSIDEAYTNSDLQDTCPEEVKLDAHKWLIKKRISKIGK